MNKLEEARKIINEADKEIVIAFKKRMEAVKEVINYKMANNLPILDSSREQIVKEKNLALLDDPILAPYYLELLDTILKVSKDYQKDLYSE